MRSYTTPTAAFKNVAQLAFRRMTTGGAMLVFPALLPRFGEPSAILIADITCPNAVHTVAAAPVRSAASPAVGPTRTLRASMPLNAHQSREITKPAVRPGLAVRLREMWESRVRTSPAVAPARTAAPVATRSGDQQRSS